MDKSTLAENFERNDDENKSKMNITKEQIDDLKAILKVEIQKEDYSTNVDKKLKEYQKFQLNLV
jgi:hypothetical protein